MNVSIEKALQQLDGLILGKQAVLRQLLACILAGGHVLLEDVPGVGKTTLAGFLFACAICAYFFGQGGSVTAVVVWGCLMSFFNLGAWGVLYTYTPELYPVRFRAFGSGWAGAVGRVGGILAPMAVAALITQPEGFSKIFMMFTGVLLAVVAVIVLLGEETRGRTLEDISS